MKRGQIWVETVIYTLIAFIIISVVLSIVKPKIEEFQDKAIIEESIDLINNIKDVIREIDFGGAGNQRIITLELSKGTLNIDGVNDKIIYEIESEYEYSENGTIYSEGGVDIVTIKKGAFNVVTLTKDYSDKYNITYEREDKSKLIHQNPTDYQLIISNKGKEGGEKVVINTRIS